MNISFDNQHYVWSGSFEERFVPQKTGFTWNKKRVRWESLSAYPALMLIEHATGEALKRLLPLEERIEESFRDFDTGAEIPAPDGLSYMPFQKAGIEYAAQFPRALIADQPGLGKTIQAIGVANLLGLKRILVVCPASVRINWARELEKWHLLNPGVSVLFSGKSSFTKKGSVVVSYDLAVKRIDALGRFDLIVVDEAHYLKNWSAKRTKVLLASGKGPLITAAPRTAFLTGTPVPNTPAEFYTILRSAAPQVIDQMSYSRFIDYFLKQTMDKYGRITFTANKRPEEFSKRLRSGFMARRLKKDVLPQLPDKQYKLVVFEAVGKRIKEVLKREADFSVSELIAKGAPVGSALPEIRKEMGLAKIPLVIDYLKEMLDGGVDKVAVFGHHVDVVVGLHAGMAGYGSVIITGKTSAAQRQNAIDRFMNDSSVRVFAGNLIAGGVGITLTSACEVAIAEPSWVPGENEQAVDRLHRIGQERKVTVHTLVVEGSLDAKILGAAAGKRFNINEVIGG